MSSILVVVPEAAYHAASALLGNHPAMAGPVTFENKVAFQPAAGKEISSAVRKTGIPSCIVAFNNMKSSVVMWKDRIIFDAVGKVIDHSVFDWVIDPQLKELIAVKLQIDAKKYNGYQIEKLVTAFTCPDFCPNQIEYGKRYALSQMLLD